jgi:hypothetical protein
MLRDLRMLRWPAARRNACACGGARGIGWVRGGTGSVRNIDEHRDECTWMVLGGLKRWTSIAESER